MVLRQGLIPKTVLSLLCSHDLELLTSYLHLHSAVITGRRHHACFSVVWLLPTHSCTGSVYLSVGGAGGGMSVCVSGDREFAYPSPMWTT